MLFRTLIFSLAAAFPSLSPAECFGTPSWHGDPITQDCIDALPRTEETALQRAQLRLLLLSQHAIPPAVEEVTFRLLPTVLMHYDGDRRALRRQIRNGTPIDLFNAVDIEALRGLADRPRNDPALDRFTRLPWLNGCTHEAIEMLEGRPHSIFGADHVIALGMAPDSENMLHEEPGSFGHVRAAAIQDLLDADTPENAEAVLVRFQEQLRGLEGETFYAVAPYETGVEHALSLVRGESRFTAPSVPQMPENPSFDERVDTVAAWTQIAI